MVFVKYSAEIKIIAIRLRLQGDNLETINDRLDIEISRQSLDRWMDLYLTKNCVLADPRFYETRGAPKILTNEERIFVKEMLEDDPTLYLDEISTKLLEQTGVNLSISALAIEIRDRLALTRKVARTVHPNQSPLLRGLYLEEVSGIPPKCLIFLGEFNMRWLSDASWYTKTMSLPLCQTRAP